MVHKIYHWFWIFHFIAHALVHLKDPSLDRNIKSLNIKFSAMNSFIKINEMIILAIWESYVRSLQGFFQHRNHFILISHIFYRPGTAGGWQILNMCQLYYPTNQQWDDKYHVSFVPLYQSAIRWQKKISQLDRYNQSAIGWETLCVKMYHSKH